MRVGIHLEIKVILLLEIYTVQFLDYGQVVLFLPGKTPRKDGSNVRNSVGDENILALMGQRTGAESVVPLPSPLPPSETGGPTQV